MEQKSIIQEESLEGVIKTVKDLITQLDVKIKCTIKKTARSEWSSRAVLRFNNFLSLSYFAPIISTRYIWAFDLIDEVV